MRVRARAKRRSSLLGILLGLTSAACTTTLDPTTWEPPPSGCVEPPGAAGAAFSSCADLPPCTSVGAEGAHLLCSHALAYDAAAHECELRGGQLAEIDSEAENLAVAEAAGAVGTNVWLGGRRDEAFVWTWTRSAIVFWRGEEAGVPEAGVFVNWQPGEPNNDSTVLDEPEKCLALTLGEVDWNDRACSLKLPFVCEVD